MRKGGIQNTIKDMMKKEGVTYREIAERMGCSFQNVWVRLNDVDKHSFTSLRAILNAFGHDFDVQPAGDAMPVDKEDLFASFEKTKTSYESAAATMKALHYRLVII